MATIVDSYSEANQDSDGCLQVLHPSAASGLSAISHSFTGNGLNLDSVQLYIKKVGSPVGKITCYLYEHTGTFGTSSLPTGSALDTSIEIDVSTLGADYALVEFSGFSGYTLVNGTKYCIVLAVTSYTSMDSDNRPCLGCDSSSPSHGGNMGYYNNSAWTIFNTRDVCFYVYGVPAGVTVTPDPASAIAQVVAPTVVKGSISITPSPVEAKCEVVAPTVKPKAFSVQRGLITLTGTDSEISLDTPVPVGKSFVIASCRSTVYECYKSLAEVRLTTPVGGCYTKIKATRGQIGGTVYVEWQVITGDDFAVQEGETSFSDGENTQLETINEVDLSKTFLVLSNFNYGSCEPYFGHVKGRFTSSTQLEFMNGIGTETYYPTVYWYVVEWEGASVQSGLVSVSTNVNTDSINQVNLNKAFLIFNYRATDSTYVARSICRGRFSANNQVEFKRGGSTDAIFVSYFVVEHPGISVQSGLKEITDYSSSFTLTTPIDVSKSFLPVPLQGNAYHTEASNLTLHYARNTHKLWQDGSDSKITIERGNSTGTLFACWFAIEYKGATVTPDPAQSIASVIAPTVLLGPTIVTPEYIKAIAQVVQPTVKLGSIFFSPTAVDAIAKGVNPSIILGSLTLSPDFVVALAKGIDPTVILGSTTATPEYVKAIAAVIPPTVAGEAIYVSPDPASAIAGIVAPTVILGSIVITPDEAYAIGQVVAPNVILGNIIISNGIAESICTVVAPTVIGGDITLTPESIEAIARGENPEVILGSIIVTPEFVRALAGVIAPTVLETWIGRKLRIKIVTSQYRSLDVVTSQHRNIDAVTAQKRKIRTLTTGS